MDLEYPFVTVLNGEAGENRAREKQEGLEVGSCERCELCVALPVRRCTY